jgi:hypothetical protein
MPKNDDKPRTQAKDMDPDLEAKRSGPPPTGRSMPKPLADPDPPMQTDQVDHAGEPAEDIHAIEAKLKDPTFDPEGHERLRLAEESQRQGSGRPYPPTSDVDERGDPMTPGERNPERQA